MAISPSFSNLSRVTEDVDQTDPLLAQAEQQTKELAEIRRALLFLCVLGLLAAVIGLAAFVRGA